MSTISQADFDKLVSYTIRIELQDGNLLMYDVSTASKKAFQKALMDENHGGFTQKYIWIYIPGDRLVFINKKDVTRITFCFESIPGLIPEYFDNFSKLKSLSTDLFEGEELEEDESADEIIPQLIIMHHRQKETTQIVKGVTMTKAAYYDNISYYSSLAEGDVYGFEFEYSEDMNEFELLVGQYLQFIDDDGEENFMPLSNLSIVEIERVLVMNDEILQRYLENEH